MLHTKSAPAIKRLPPLWVIRAIGKLRSWLMSLGRGMFPPDYVVMETAAGFWVAKAMGVAVKLELADILSQGPLSIDELARRTNTHAPSLLRLLRVLSAHGIFRHLKNNEYANTRLSEALMEDRNSMKYFVGAHLGDNNWHFLGDLEQAVKTGKNAIVRKTGQEPFDFLRDHPAESALFDRAMTDSNELSIPLFLAAFNFGAYKNIIDIGGGQGYLLSAILAKHTKSEGLVYDQPHVVSQAERNFERFHVTDRAGFRAGSFFDEIPGDGSLYLMKNILHDWDDATCLDLLARVKRTMPAGAHLLIIEALICDDNKPAFGKLLDLQMLIGTTGGRERTADEFRQLLQSAGLSLCRIIDTATPFSFILAE